VQIIAGADGVGDRVWVGTQVSSQCIVFWRPLDIIIGRFFTTI